MCAARACVYLQALGLGRMGLWYCQDSRGTGLRQAPICKCMCHAQERATHLSPPTDRWPSFCLHHHSAERNKAPSLSPMITNLAEDLGQIRLRREDQGRAGVMLCQRCFPSQGQQKLGGYGGGRQSQLEWGGGHPTEHGQPVVVSPLWWQRALGATCLPCFGRGCALHTGDCPRCLLGARKAF